MVVGPIDGARDVHISPFVHRFAGSLGFSICSYRILFFFVTLISQWYIFGFDNENNGCATGRKCC